MISSRYSSTYLRDMTILYTKQFLRSKKTIKVTLNSMTRIRLIIYIKDPEEAFSVNYTHIEDTKAEETIIVDIITTSHPVRSNVTSIINLNTS